MNIRREDGMVTVVLASHQPSRNVIQALAIVDDRGRRDMLHGIILWGIGRERHGRPKN